MCIQSMLSICLLPLTQLLRHPSPFYCPAPSNLIRSFFKKINQLSPICAALLCVGVYDHPLDHGNPSRAIPLKKSD